MPEKTEVVLRWRGQVKEKVEVAGEFNKWTPSLLDKEGDSWLVKLELEPGKYQYKFVVDGEWKVNKDLPIVTDSQGIENNQVEVEDSELSGDSDSWEKVSIPETGEKISVVERIFSLNVEQTMEMIRANNGELVEEKEFADIYYDTDDFILLSKGVWLRQRKGDDESSWQIRGIVEKELEVVDNLDEVKIRLKEELGKDLNIDNLEAVVEDMVEVVRMEGKVSKWLIGSTEVEVRKEGDVETALVRVVGDIVAALKDLETSAANLKLFPFNGEMEANRVTGAA